MGGWVLGCVVCGRLLVSHWFRNDNIDGWVLLWLW